MEKMDIDIKLLFIQHQVNKRISSQISIEHTVSVKKLAECHDRSSFYMTLTCMPDVILRIICVTFMP